MVIGRGYLAATSLLVTSALMFCPAMKVAAAQPEQAHVGAVLEAGVEYGGDNVAEVFYTNGTTQNIKAGQGLAVGAGLHYQPAASPFDLAATIGYKYMRTAAYNTNLGIDRVTFKLIGTYALPNRFWLAAGPVWHTGTKFNGDGFAPDIKFDDAFGGTVGFGWRWIGAYYTSIRYRSSLLVDSIDGSNVGVLFTWKF
jgi:hypothetical protein